MNKGNPQKMMWPEIKLLKKILILFGENNIFIVGGAVRNLISNKPVEDIDLAVKLNTVQVKEKLKKKKYKIY